MEKVMAKLGWEPVIILCLTLGLAPYSPPHIWEKLRMLLKGRLIRPIDWLDLFLHGMPWVLLALKSVHSLKAGK